MTWEHVWLYGGKQINETWAIIFLCDFAHGTGLFAEMSKKSGAIFDKRINEWISVNLMTDADEKKYHKTNWKLKRSYLNSLFGELKLPN